jgi:hypothetical protein
MRMIFASTLVCALLIAVPESRVADEPGPSAGFEREFGADGRISMNLSAGEYRITGTTDSRIRLDWTVRERHQLSRVQARVDVSGRDASVTTDGPDNSGFRVAIQVPVRADLHIRLTAGDLTIEGIEGNKDVALHAGELNIDLGRAEDYERVEASVWAGELNAAPYQVNKGGLFRSFEWRGDGSYRLQAHLKAGEVHLYSRPRR